MFLALKLLQENGEGPSAVAAPNQTLRVGRLKHGNHLYVADPLLAPVHFEVICDARGARVSDLSARGVQRHAVCERECFTAALRNARCSGSCRLNDRGFGSGLYLNGQLVRDAALEDGDLLVAGTSCFAVTLSEQPTEPAPRAQRNSGLSREQRLRALDFFSKQKLPLFALVDAARTPELLDLLHVHAEVHYSLYDGPEGEKLDAVAPYLVELHARSALLEALLSEQWGNSWGVFALALSDFKGLRRHLRRFLMVEDAHGKDMYFRFYDPRVLRAFLPSCTVAELTEFFGPVRAFVLESEEPGAAWSCALEQGQLLVDPVTF